MRNFRSFFFIGAFYELLRVIGLFIFTFGFISPQIDEVHGLLFVMLAAPGFTIFAGMVMIGVHPGKFRGGTKLLAFGKLAGLLSAIFAALNALGILTFKHAQYQLYGSGLLFGLFILFDLIFFLFLISYKEASTPPETTISESETVLPEIQEVTLEE